MKKNFLVVLLVLSFVLVGCGQKDYTDVNLYKDLLVQKYNEIDKDFFNSYNEALSKTGIKEGMNNLVNSSLNFIDESLDLLGDDSETFYNNFKEEVDNITEVPFTQEDIDAFVADFEAIPDNLKESSSNLVNDTLDASSKEIDKMTSYIKDLSAEQVKKLKEGVKVLIDKGDDVYEAVYDYVNEQLGN